MMRAWFLAAVGICIAAGGPVSIGPSFSLAAPEPEPIPRRWQLRIDPGELRYTVIDVAGSGPRGYLYMTYKVVNNSGEDRDFAPSFELSTDQGSLIRSGRDVPHQVVQELLQRANDPFLQDETAVQGRLLQGEEHAKEALIIWVAPELEAGEYTIYAMGFSGETKAVVRPDNGEEHVLRKTLMLIHQGTGRLDAESGRPLPRRQTRWILR